MESLGGNSRWSDRFLGYHVAFAYYWLLIAVYLGSPRIAYQFMELLEAHAVDTYTTFVRENRDRLAQLPPPNVAVSYYKTGDLYLFDDFQVSRVPGSRRPPCETLLDVFTNIALDEGEHVKTMQACQDYASFGIKVVSPHLIGSEVIAHDESKAATAAAEEAKRRTWKEWSDRINDELAGTH
jgi:ubiquinol oxidase